MPSRRKFFQLATGLIAAPAIVKVSALMPLRGQPLAYDANWRDPFWSWNREYEKENQEVWAYATEGIPQLNPVSFKDGHYFYRMMADRSLEMGSFRV